MKRIESFSELRALSAIFIVFSHIGCTNQLFGGNLGGFAVCVFFMLSGFLTVFSTQKTVNKLFLVKRFLKIAPLYYTLTIFSFIIARLKPDWFNTANPNIPNLIKSLTFIPYINSNGLSRPLLDVGWYINVLMFFYLIFKISMLISHKYRGVIASGILVTLTIAGQVFIPENGIFLLYRNGMVTLSMGMIIALLYGNFSHKFADIKILNKKNPLINILLAGVYVGLIFVFCNIDINPYIKLFIPLIIFTGYTICGQCVVPSRFMAFISKISMSMYLIHEFVVKGVSRIIFNLEKLTPATLVVSILCSAVVIAVSVPVNYVFENKISGGLEKKLTYARKEN